MTKPSEDFDDPIRTVGADATAGFDNGPSNPTEHASSEALGSATTGDNEDRAVRGEAEKEPAGLEDQSDVDDLDERGELVENGQG